KDRLRGIVKPASELADLGSTISRTNAGTTNGEAVSGFSRSLSTLGGAWRETTAGRSFVISRRVAPADFPGRHRVHDFAETLREDASAAALVGRSSAETPFIFFDLETAGLNGGAGTHAFLVGCGWFDSDGGFVTEQYLMTAFADERSMLGVVA